MNKRKCLLRLFLCLSLGWSALASDAQTVNKTFHDVPLKTVLKEVESQTDFSVVYKTDEMQGERIVPELFVERSDG